MAFDFDEIKKVLQSKGHDNFFLCNFFAHLEFNLKGPELAERVFDAVKATPKYNVNSRFYTLLCEIVYVQPQLAEEVFNTVKTNLESFKHVGYNLEGAYETLGIIVRKRPELAEQVFDTFKTYLQVDWNDTISLSGAYESLARIIRERPELTKQAFDVFKTGLQSDKNKFSPFNRAYDSLQCAYFLLKDIAAERPELTEQILDMVIQSKDSDYKVYFYQLCMKRLHLPLQKTIKNHPEIEQDLRIAYEGRSARGDEFEYALRHFDREVLASSNSFSSQQHVMDILVSTSAQEAGISKEDALKYRTYQPENMRDFMQFNKNWLVPASFKAAAVFGSFFPSYIKKIRNYNRKCPKGNALSIHDVVYWLPDSMSKEANEHFRQFIQKQIICQKEIRERDNQGNVVTRSEIAHRSLDELSIIAQNWENIENRLKAQGRDITELKYNDVLSICKGGKYENRRNDDFAVEAAKNGVPLLEYHKCEDIYLAGLKVPEPFDSKKEFIDGDYVGRFLPRNDPRTIFFGNYTGCCQHWKGIGDACAVSTVKDPFSQLFVIEDKKGVIVAGSWTWENTEGDYREVCFDNIEATGEFKKCPEINRIYEQVGRYLTEEQNCHRVTIGTGIIDDADISAYLPTEAIPLPSLYGTAYTDARSQVLLKENPNCNPLKETEKSQRYVRNVCYLDVPAMQSVSKAVFPESDQELQVPENMSGFVIEDRKKGVVGYCLYDEKEKSIYDMAVLEDYRSSSIKLLSEMMRVIRKDGGEWSAEARDITTLNILRVMHNGGKIELEEHGIDHVMSDNSEVKSVTFKLGSGKIPQKKYSIQGREEKNFLGLSNLLKRLAKKGSLPILEKGELPVERGVKSLLGRVRKLIGR